MNQSNIIFAYFNSWIEKDPSVMEEHFSDDIIYTECYGPVYKGQKQCLKWFNDWNLNSSVLVWDIVKIYDHANVSIVEWYFKCESNGNVDGFDGVSIIEFAADKISSIKEFMSKSEHHFPYGDV